MTAKKPSAAEAAELEEFQKNQFREFLTKKLKDTACPFCDGEIWKPLNSSVLLPSLRIQGEPSLRNFYPILGIACANCGHMVLFHSPTALKPTDA